MESERAAIYCRVSTEDQARSGYSLPDQIASCKNLLHRQGYVDIVEYIDDGYSGEFLDRPALISLRDDISSRRISSLAVYDPDRLARKLSIQLLIAEEMEKAKVAMHFVTGDYDASPEGRLFFSMRGAIAEFEKAKILDRTSRGKRKKASQGKIIQDFGLYGYDYDAVNFSYVIDETEANVVREIFRLVADHQLSINRIQQELKSKVILSPTGKPLWPSSSIHNLLKNKTYTGTFHSMKKRHSKSGIKTRISSERPKDEWISIPVPPIIDEVTFERAQRQLRQNKANTKKAIVHPFLVGGIVFCGVCGRRMLAHHCVFRDGKYKSYYQCATQRYYNLRNAGVKCTSRSLPADALDIYIWDKFIEALFNPEKIKKYYPEKEQLQDNTGEFDRLNKLESELIKRRETIAKWFRQQMLSEKEAEEELARIKEQLTDVKERKVFLKPKPPLTPEVNFAAVAAKLRPLAAKENLTEEEKKFMVRSIISKITAIRTDSRGGHGSSKLPPTFKITWELL